MHAALADGRRRTGWPETHQNGLVPATAEEMQTVASELGPGGLTAAEAAWCAGTTNSVPIYRRPVDYAKGVLAVAERIGGVREGLTVRFDHGSKLELSRLREELGHRDLIRLPPQEEADPEVDLTKQPAGDQSMTAAISPRNS